MGSKIVYCGETGHGGIAKICNNMLLGISMIGVSETMNLGIRLGMDPGILSQIINSSSGRCWSSDTYNPVPGILPGVPSSKEYSGGFGIKLMRKDMGLAVDAAKDSQSSVFLGALSQQVYNQAAQMKGNDSKDFSVVYKFLSESK